MNKDVSWSMFFEDNEKVADLINTLILEEKDHVSSDDITDEKGKVSILTKFRGELLKISKDRDIVKKIIYGTTVIIADIETQEIVDYSYPLRELGYIFGEYEGQARKIRNKNKNYDRSKNGNPGRMPGEVLYKFRKADLLKPIVVFLLYSGKEDWDGPISLHEMLNLKDVPDTLKDMIMNHRVNIINVRKLTDEQLKQFKTELKEVFTCIKYAENMKELKDKIVSDEKYRHMSVEAVEVIAEYTHDIRWSENTEVDTKGEINMCKALDDIFNDGIATGVKQGIYQLLFAQYSDGEITIESASKRLNITAEEFLKLYEQSFNK